LDPEKSQWKVASVSNVGSILSTYTSKQNHAAGKWGLAKGPKKVKRPHNTSKSHEKATKNAYTYWQGKKDIKVSKKVKR